MQSGTRNTRHNYSAVSPFIFPYIIFNLLQFHSCHNALLPTTFTNNKKKTSHESMKTTFLFAFILTKKESFFA